MGPYCKFCQQRCFVPITYAWPLKIAEAYGRFTIAATCPAGQALEREKFGYCYADFIEARKERTK